MLKNSENHLAPSGLLLYDPPHMEEVEMYFNDPSRGIINVGSMPFRFEDQVDIDLKQMSVVLGHSSEIIDKAYRLALKHIGPGIRGLEYKRLLFHAIARVTKNDNYLAALLLMGVEPQYITSEALGSTSSDAILKYQEELSTHTNLKLEGILRIITKRDRDETIGIEGKPIEEKNNLEPGQVFNLKERLYSDSHRSVMLGQVGQHDVLMIEDNLSKKSIYLFDRAQKGAGNLAMESENIIAKGAVKSTGGIDLTSAKMNLQTRNSGGEIKFHIDPDMYQKLQNSPGFVPVIISIQPMINLRKFLGVV